MVNKLRGFKLATGGPLGGGPGPAAGGGIQDIAGPVDGPAYGSDEMIASINARPEMAYERGPLAEGNDMPDAAPAGAAGLFDSLGRVGAGLPPQRQRPVPVTRPAAALGGF